MQIVIQQLEYVSGGDTTVSFTVNMMWQCDASGQLTPIFDSGEDCGKGIWKHPDPPIIGETYDVEYIIRGSYKWGADICQKPHSCLSVRLDNGLVEFCGMIGPASEDNLIFLDVGTNLAINTVGQPAAVGSFACLQVPFSVVEVYPYFM